MQRRRRKPYIERLAHRSIAIALQLSLSRSEKALRQRQLAWNGRCAVGEQGTAIRLTVVPLPMPAPYTGHLRRWWRACGVVVTLVAGITGRAFWDQVTDPGSTRVCYLPEDRNLHALMATITV